MKDKGRNTNDTDNVNDAHISAGPRARGDAGAAWLPSVSVGNIAASYRKNEQDFMRLYTCSILGSAENYY